MLYITIEIYTVIYIDLQIQILVVYLLYLHI